MEKVQSIEQQVCNNTIIKYTFLVYILLVTISDFPLQLTFGTIARTVYVFVSPVIFFLITGLTYKFYIVRGIRYYLTYYAYSLFISLILVLYFVFILNHDLHIFGENLFIKLVKASMYNLIIIISLYNYYFIFRFTSSSFLEKILKHLLLLQLVVGFIQILYPPAFDFIKTPVLSGGTDRLSLLNSEPSLSFPQLLTSLLCYLVMRLYNNKKLNINDLLVMVASFIIILYIQSKGGFANIIITFIFIVLFGKQSFKTRMKVFLVSLLFIIPTYWVIVNIILPPMLQDPENLISVTTRSITLISSVQGLLTYPFGQGYSTFYITYPTLLNQTINSITTWATFPVPTYELDMMIETGRSLGVKSGLLNETLYSGWAIIIFYAFFFRDILKKINSLSGSTSLFLIFQFIFIFFVINYLFVASIETSYIAFMPFALLERLHERRSSIVTA